MKKLTLIILILTLALCAQAEDDLKVLAGFKGHSEKPFSDWNINHNEPTGFDPDLLRLIAEELKLNLKFVQIDLTKNWFDVRREVIEAGLVDAVSYAYTITENRKKHLAFSTPYKKSSMNALVLKKGEIKKNDDLHMAPILAFKHTTGYQWAVKNHKGKIITSFPKGFKGYIQDMLTQGHASAYIGDKDNLEAMAKDDDRLTLIKEPLMLEELGIAVSKKNPELLKKINKAINTLEESGKLSELREKYFSDK
jgi:ABC-type amino acid transport substrate-binding protein